MKKKLNNVLIIAEAGVNHNGSMKLAKSLIKEASKTGADFIKFQTFKADNLVTKKAIKAPYQRKNSNKKELAQYEMLKKYELDKKKITILKKYCNKCNIKFLSSIFDIESFNLLNTINEKYIKIPSSEIDNYPLLNHLSKFKKKYFLSTGISNMKEINQCIKILISGKVNMNDIYILHCNSSYPTSFEDLNLNNIKTLQQKFNNNIGFSDHSIGVEGAIAAVALGAKVIEKHFTTDKKLSGPDQKISLTPSELKLMVSSIRNIEKSLGSFKKEPTKSELKNKLHIRKSIVAKKDIKKNQIFTTKNITTKRPGNGLTPMLWEKVLGKKAIKDFKKDSIIKI